LFSLSPEDSLRSEKIPETVYADSSTQRRSEQQQYLYTENKKSNADVYFDNIYNGLKRSSSRNEENLLNKRGEELLRVYDLYRRHSLKESLDLIKSKVEGIIARDSSREDEHPDAHFYDSNSDVSIQTLKKAIELLKKSIVSRKKEEEGQKPNLEVESKQQTTTPEEAKQKSQTKKRREEETTLNQLDPKHSTGGFGREEVAVPVYTQTDENKEPEEGELYL